MKPDTTAPRDSQNERWRKRALKIGIAVGAILLVLALMIFVLPTPLARWVISSQLETLGIEHDGINTVDIDLWEGAVRAGPVSFHSADARDGRIGEVGFTYSFGAIFKGRALLQTFYLRGVDLFIARHENGSITINGIALNQDNAPSTVEPETTEPQGPLDLGVALGVERFDFTDSRLVFEDVTGGELVIDVAKLTFERLFTWTPEEPTAFALDGTMNEMQLSLDGTVLPFRDPLRFTLNTRLHDITLDRVARFVGSTGLARQDGTLDSESRYEFAIYPDGSVEGTASGTYYFSDFAIATPEGDTLTVGAATLHLDVDQQLQADGSAKVQGKLSLDASSLAAATALGDNATIASVELLLNDISLDQSAERRDTIFDFGKASTSTGNTAASLISLMVDWAGNVALEALSHRLTFDGKPALTLNKGQIKLASRGDVPGQSLGFDALTIDLGTVDSEAVDDGFSASLGLNTVLTALTVAVPDGGPQASVARTRLASNAIDISALRGSTTLKLDIAADMDTVEATDGKGRTLALGTVSLGSDGFTIVRSTTTGEASGPFTALFENLEAHQTEAEGDLTLRGKTLNLALDQLSMTSDQGGAAKFAGNIALDGVSFERGGKDPMSVTMASQRTQLHGISLAPIDGNMIIEGAIDDVVTDVSFESGSGTGALKLELQTLRNSVTAIRASDLASDKPAVSLAASSWMALPAHSLPAASSARQPGSRRSM